MSIQKSAVDFNDFEDEDEINISEILHKYLYHWPLFLVAIVLSLSGAFIYLRYSTPIYDINSSLLIKDEKKGGTSEDMLSQIDLFGDSKVVENEIEILRSKELMRKVVSRLHLDVNYLSEGRVINSDIYERRPVNLISIKMNKFFYGKNLELSFPDTDHYLLKDVLSGMNVRGELNVIQRNKFGIFRIDKNVIFSKGSSHPFNLQLGDPIDVANDCLSGLNIAIATKQSTVLKLSYLTTVPQRGIDILNTLVDVYNEASLADKNRTTQSTIQFIDERLALITGELTSVEKDVEGFKTSQGLTDISNEATLFLDNVKANDEKLNEVEVKLGVIKNILRYVDSVSPGEKLPSTLGIDDPGLLMQITKLSDLQLQKESLLATTQANNPILTPVNKQLETTRASIRSTVQSIESTLSSTRNSLRSNDSKYLGAIKKFPGQERQYISIKRQQGIKEALYLYLLQKKEEAALSYASLVVDSRVVDSAYSTGLVKPKKQMTYIFAFLFGVLFPIAYVYIKELLNNRVASLSEIEKLTTAPVLGEVMQNDGTDAIVVEPTSRSAIAEQFRAIRTNLQFIYGTKDKGRVTMFTSSMSGEGKSFVAANIGTALAISGRKTVLLELDLRKPKISKYLNLSNRIGLSNYLIGKVDISDIIQPSGINQNLYIISSGPIPPNPSELLIHSEIEILIEYLKKNFDDILIDTAPIGLVTDAQILARLVDATIYLTRQGVTFKKQLEKLNVLYRNGKFPKLNIILNGIAASGRYGYGAGAGYGYGYGYYSDDKKKKLSFLKGLKNLFNRF